MQIELRDMTGGTYRCDSMDTTILAKWLKSWIPEIAKSTFKYHTPWQIQIWISNETEAAYMEPNNALHVPQFVNSDNMRELASTFTEAAKRMEKVENRNRL